MDVVNYVDASQLIQVVVNTKGYNTCMNIKEIG